VPSRFPPINLFEAVADPADLDAVYQIEAMTNDRLREEVGDISLVPPDDRVSGPGSSPTMAAFTHLNPEGDRFTNGTYGVFYAGRAIETAIAETRYHRIGFLQATREPAQEIDMRVYAVDLEAELHDIRAMRESHPAYYHPTRYGVSQELALHIREGGSDGIVYGSVRDEGGECAAVFRPRLLSNCRQERHLCYVWDGRTISTIYEKRDF
ncbi:MAG: RES family NAD+ phosphorylase, partial [Verrucomicrobiaceae bacterium]